jgi:hypothetical protein
VRGAGLEAEDGAESGACEFGGAGSDGAELEGAEFEGGELCAHPATLPASNKTKSQLRIMLFYRLRAD